MITIGITGGYATGKSVVAGMFKEKGAKAASADSIARIIMKPRTLVWEKVVNCFGKEILRKDKFINRKKLAEIVFMDYKKRQKLNQLVHPVIINEIKLMIKSTGESGRTKVFVLDVPLLFEAGIEELFDKIIVVICRNSVQINRAKRRDKLSRDQIFRRIQSQIPLRSKARRADFVIDNNGTIAKTKKQVEDIWSLLFNVPPEGEGRIL